jgi:hypothetical protein
MGQYIQENIKKEPEMDMENLKNQMATFLQEIFQMVFLMVQEFISGIMVILMKVNFNLENQMVLVI